MFDAELCHHAITIHELVIVFLWNTDIQDSHKVMMGAKRLSDVCDMLTARSFKKNSKW